MVAPRHKAGVWLLLSLAWAGFGWGATVPNRTSATGNHYRITTWTTAQGLPQNTINCLLQTRDGYLWCGTRCGLARFDGLRFTIFAEAFGQESTEVLDVRDLAEDAQGRLWLRLPTGLVSFEHGAFTKMNLEVDLTPAAQKLCASRSGGLWVALRDGAAYLDQGKITRVFHFTNRELDLAEQVDLLQEDSQGRLWLRIHRQPNAWWWTRYDPATGKVETLAQVTGCTADDVSGLLEEEDRRYWIVRPGALICGTPGDMKQFSASNAWNGQPIKQMVMDQQRNLWVLSEGESQLHCFDAGECMKFGWGAGVPDPGDIRCLLPDREGNLWVGTGRNGLIRIQPRQLVTLLEGSYVAHDEVFSIAPGMGGRVWLATAYGLVLGHQGQFTILTNTVSAQADNWIRRPIAVLEDHQGTVWAGLDRGLCTLQGDALAPIILPTLEANGSRLVTSLLEDSRGTLWIGTPCGLLQREGGRFRLWTTNDGLTDLSVFGLVEGPAGHLWAGTQRGGINCLHGGRFQSYTTREGLLSNEAWPLRAEPDGTLWVGTPRGLNRIRPGQIRSVTTREGLNENLAYCLLDDGQGRYWSFGNRGIWRVSKAELHRVADGQLGLLTCVNYSEDDGMESAEGNGDQQPNAAAMPNGELWFPTTRGVVTLDPKKLRDNAVPPGVVIEEVRVDEEVVFKDGKYAPPAGDGSRWPPLVSLPPGRARVLEIRYTANTFVDSDQARFRYRLEGHETSWQEANTRRVALYTNLRPGTYRFCVEACNRHGCWSRVPAQFAFSLAPYFYQTGWFLGSCTLMVISAVVGWHWRRLRVHARWQGLEQERALHDERGRIAKDLHDDLGANLIGIGLQIELVRRQMDQTEMARQPLQTIREAVQTMVERMREVVWSLNPKNDTLESLCAFVSDYAEEFLGAAGLSCQLEFPEHLPDWAVSAQTRHSLMLILKEALNNAVRHAQASRVRIAIALTEESLRLTISDNGCGFAPEAKCVSGGPAPDASRIVTPTDSSSLSGLGLESMRSRATSLSGSFILQSEPGSGTELIIQVPLPPHR